MARKAVVDQCRELVEAEMAGDVRSRLQDLSLEESSARQRLETLLHEVTSPIQRLEISFADVQDFLGQQQRLARVHSVSKIPYLQHHNENYREVMDGTGQWFTNRPELRAWNDSSRPAILWLRGPPGAGKTKLV